MQSGVLCAPRMFLTETFNDQVVTRKHQNFFATCSLLRPWLFKFGLAGSQLHFCSTSHLWAMLSTWRRACIQDFKRHNACFIKPNAPQTYVPLDYFSTSAPRGVKKSILMEDFPCDAIRYVVYLNRPNNIPLWRECR
jgi:hypothetical protein